MQKELTADALELGFSKLVSFPVAVVHPTPLSASDSALLVVRITWLSSHPAVLFEAGWAT
jgi:hypothetical protein